MLSWVPVSGSWTFAASYGPQESCGLPKPAVLCRHADSEPQHCAGLFRKCGGEYRRM